MNAFTPEPDWPPIDQLARELWGEPNQRLSGGRKLRFGSLGSKEVDLDKSIWFDHESGEGGGYFNLHRLARNCDPPKSHKGNGKLPPWEDVACIYDYEDADGRPLLQVVRTISGAPRFRQRPDAKAKWPWSVKHIPNHDCLLYRLPGLLAAGNETVWVVEGEKDADRLHGEGLIATTSIGGAGKWRAAYAEAFRGKRVVILPDNDHAGRSHADDIVQSLHGVATSIKVLPLPDLADKQDVSDWLDNHGTIEDLRQLANAQPEWEPPPKPEPTTVDEVVTWFNSRFAVTREGGSVLIMQFKAKDDGTTEFIRMKVGAFREMYGNRFITVGDKARPIADVWLKSKQRRQYPGGTVFDPTNRHDSDELNLWTGLATKPALGDWSLLREHIRTVICRGDEAAFTYLLNWMARLVQYPGMRGETAVVMRGEEGVGKGILANALIHIIGSEYAKALVQPTQLVGRFNSILQGCVFLFADEAIYAGDRKVIGALKQLITEERLTIERKGFDVFSIKNCLHLMMSSNEDWVIPMGLKARRFLVLDVADDYFQDRAYFNEIHAQLAAGGYAAMLHDLLHIDISQWDHRNIPETAAAHQQKQLSLSTNKPELAWYQQVLERGYVFKSNLGLVGFYKWSEKITTDLAYLSYLAYAQQHRVYHTMHLVTFGKFMSEMAGHRIRLPNKTPIGEHLADETNNGEHYHKEARPLFLPDHQRPWGYRLGTLTQARNRFESVTGLKHEWPPEPDTDPAALKTQPRLPQQPPQPDPPDDDDCPI